MGARHGDARHRDNDDVWRRLCDVNIAAAGVREALAVRRRVTVTRAKNDRNRGPGRNWHWRLTPARHAGRTQGEQQRAEDEVSFHVCRTPFLFRMDQKRIVTSTPAM